MTMSLKTGGAWHTITAPKIKVAGAWHPVASGFVKVAGVWRKFFSSAPPMTLTTTPASLTINSNNATISGGVTCNVAGGVGPFNYAWNAGSAAGDGITITAGANAATATFTKTGAVSTETYAGTATCVVTDTGNGNAIGSVNVFISFHRN